MPRPAPRLTPGRAHVRSLGTLAAFLLAFCCVSFLALGVRAQGPPGHEHSWEAGDPIRTPVVEAGSLTVEVGHLVSVGATNVGPESDHCTVTEPECPFFANVALDPTHVSAWSD